MADPPQTEIMLELVGGGALVRVVGDLDLGCAARFDSTMSGAFELADRWEIDLAAVTFVDSTGVRCLVRAWRESLRRGSPVVITGTSPSVRRVLDLSGLTRYLL